MMKREKVTSGPETNKRKGNKFNGRIKRTCLYRNVGMDGQIKNSQEEAKLVQVNVWKRIEYTIKET